MIKWLNSTLRNKILFGFFTVLLIMVIITLFGVYNFYIINQSLKRTIAQNHSSIVAADNMGKAIDKQILAINLFYGDDLIKGDSLFKEAKTEFVYWYLKAKETAFTSKEKILLDSLNSDYIEFLKKTYSTKYLDKSGRLNILGFDRKNEEFLRDINRIKQQCYGIFDINNNILKGIIQKTDSIIDSTTKFLVVFLIFGIAFSLFFSIKFSNYLITPLKNLIKSIRFIAEGNFSEKIKNNYPDELGKLAIEFNSMSSKLEKYEKMNIDRMQYEKQKADTIIESINEPVVITDEDLCIYKANKEFLDFFEFNVMNQNLMHLLVENKFFESEQVKNLKDNTLTDIIIVNNKNVRTQYFKIIRSLVEITDSSLSGYVFVFHDITRFREIDKLKSEFIGKVSHELKTPLTSMGMALGIIEDGIVGTFTTEQNNIITAIKEDYTRLKKLVHEILELTKLESNKIHLNIADIETKMLIESLKKNFFFQIEEKKIFFDFKITSGAEYIKADYDYIIRALDNIMANSIKFTEKGGKIEIKAYCDDFNNYISVSDNGIGMNQKDIDRVFDKFVQIKDNIPGSVGLGLSIAKEIVDLHKGEILVKSEIGKGSCFIVKLNRN
ncbi:MAG TPA: ATP-binding protein [Melioribacteraceae bacterium]|nr:ATP-binding protein [Melioribacteraceae bacterium]